ncbi:MAG: exosortase family protein XrtF [Flammeovirgaceae bacterium]
MKGFLNKLTPFHWFLIKAVGLYVIWIAVCEPLLIKENGEGLNGLITVETARVASWVIDALPYDSTIDELPGQEGAYLLIDGRKVVFIADPCNALVIIALYVGFIIAYPGPLKTKIAFIIGGSIIVFLLNVLRVIALAFNQIYHASSLEFNHKYTFTFMVYAVVFAMWMVWANKYSSVKFTASK